MNKQEKREKSLERLTKVKRILALAGAVLLILLYLVTFILAFGKSQNISQWFSICFGATFLVPLTLYAMFLIYKVLNNYGQEQGKDKVQEEDDE